ncbi:MAG: hypothetical protein GY794_07915, partial [bacterium]|nr:hypothetical protein [bacterium]
LRLDPTADSDQPIITRFGVADGLPAGWTTATTVGGRVMFRTGQGNLFRRTVAEAGAWRGRPGQTSDLGFVPDTTFNILLAQGSSRIQRLTEDDQGQVWITAGEASGVAYPSADGGYTFAPTALRRVPHSRAYDMLAEAGGQLWVGGPDGLIRLDSKSHPLDSSTEYPVWIRRITTTGDSLLYDGQPGEAGEAAPWPYQSNALRFSFAAPRYDAPERTHYRTRLDGLDDGWSAWSMETDKDYTNLREGRYVFLVQARDVYGFISREDSFTFQIQPPWYRTWYMYLAYAITLIGLLYLLYRWRAGSLINEKLILEKIVKDRTAEIQGMNEELNRQNEELATTMRQLKDSQSQLIQTEKMASLGQLIAGIAHE